MICRNCGMEMKDDAIVCAGCGAQLTPAPRRRARVNPQNGDAYSNAGSSGQIHANDGAYGNVGNRGYAEVSDDVYVNAGNGAYIKAGTGAKRGAGRSAGSSLKHSGYRKGGSNPIPAVVAGAAAILLVVALLGGLLGGDGCKTAVNNLVNGILEGNGDVIVQSIPDELYDAMAKEVGMTKDAAKSLIGREISAGIKPYVNQLSNGNRSDIKIVGTKKLTGSSFESLQRKYTEYDVKVQAAQHVSIGVDEGNAMELAMIKVGGKWYLDLLNVI